MRIDYHPAIAAELEEIRDHYEACSPGLGSDFVDEFERQVLKIAIRVTVVKHERRHPAFGLFRR